MNPFGVLLLVIALVGGAVSVFSLMGQSEAELERAEDAVRDN